MRGHNRMSFLKRMVGERREKASGTGLLGRRFLNTLDALT